MGLKIKQLKQHNEVFVPITAAEAVLVRHKGAIAPLTRVLDEKVETIDVSEDPSLEVQQSGPLVLLRHKSKITANDAPQPLLLRHDSAGHIVETQPMGRLTVKVNDAVHLEVNGTNDASLNMGDDFTVDNLIIKLNWSNL